jgi:cysteinyl-tRNA synthetase
MLKPEAKGLKLYNTISKEKVHFLPINTPFVGMYVCGPTVYSEVHLGNVRTFLSFDIVFRYLQHLGYKVRYVRNITDVGHLVDDVDYGEDKIAKKARLENLEPMEIVQRYTYGFHRVMDMFNILPPSIEPTATAHIMEQIQMTQRILSNGFGYVVNGSVYFDVLKYNKTHNYGKLSGRVLDELLTNTRDLDGQDEKRNPLDFALWKKADKGHIMKWDSPWGVGFPGWHLECSAMSTKYLGETFDIHGGGMDLKFPHHECEIAQSVAADGNEAVRYWMHGNMLTVNGQKMSKSLGNSFTPQELISGNHPLLEKSYGTNSIRFFMLQSHYSSTLDFTNEALNAAEKGYKRLMSAWQNVKDLKAAQTISPDQNLNSSIEKLCQDCYAEMNDDFNTPKTIAVLFELAGIANSLKNGQLNIEHVTAQNIELMQTTFQVFIGDILGLQQETEVQNNKLDAIVHMLIDMRKEARNTKNFALSDAIRDKLKANGITLKDDKDGTTSFSID